MCSYLYIYIYIRFIYILILHSPFLMNFLLKEMCTAHKHQLLNFKNVQKWDTA